MSTLPSFLRWFVATKRKTAGVNYSRAVSFGMPKGRGRKGEAPPRKRKKRAQVAILVERNEIAPGCRQLSSEHNPFPSCSITPPNGNSMQTSHRFPCVSHTQQQNIRPANIQLSNLSLPFPPAESLVRLPYPAPTPNSFILYFLHFCPPLTSVCFGCGIPLKPSGNISAPPGDLVIVSFMPRQWMHEGQFFSKSGRVYFHCSSRCVQIKQPAFDPINHLTVPDDVKQLLMPIHHTYITQNLGLSL